MDEEEDVVSPGNRILGWMAREMSSAASTGGAGCNFLPPKNRQSPVFCPPAEFHDDRCRDVFPLPMMEGEARIARRGICRSVKQRCFKRAAVNKRVNLAITALNSLFFGNDSWEVPQTCHDLRALPSPQRDAIQNIIKCVKDAGGPPKGACYSEALKALRVASNGYFDTAGGVGDTVAMNLQLLSLPSLAGKGVDLASTLEGKAGEMLRDFESHMLQHDVNWVAFSQHTEPVKPYSDPQLSQRGFYGDFLARLQQCGILAFSLQPRGRVGAFCVSKKPKEVDGRVVQRQRLILDCRQTNMLFRAPPLTELGSLSALSEGYLRPQDDLFIGGADIQDCFYACKIPPELSRYFCLSQDITVGEARAITGECLPDWMDGLNDGAVVSPCINVLPMGYSWSFYLVQKLHEQQTLSTLGLKPTQLVIDARPVGDFASNRCLGMPYCDNVHVLSTDENQCEDGRKQVCAQLRNVGFGVHEEIGACKIFPTLGGIIKGEVGTINPTPVRLWNLIYGFEYCTKHPVSSDFIQRLLGHAMTVCVLCRPGMSVFRTLYDYSCKGFPPQKLWPSAIRECHNFIGILPLLVGNLRRPWATRVFCSDASPAGYGLLEGNFPIEDVESVGSWNERWRFKRLDPEHWRPRERSLHYNVFLDHSTARRPEPLAEDSFEYEENPEFPEVPFDMLNPKNWSTAKMGMWRRTSDHITLKEGKAFILGMRRVTRNSALRGHRILYLVDNLALAMSLSKGRSHNFGMLRVCQQYAALALATNTSVRVRWVPSELNLADGPSRGELAPGSSWEKFAEQRKSIFKGSDPETQDHQNPAWRQTCESSWGEDEPD